MGYAVGMSERDPNDDVYQAVLDAMRHLRVDYQEGAGSTRQLVGGGTCESCDTVGSVYYTGSDVLEGDLEYFHLVHTEVDHHLRCEACGHRWTVFKML